MTMREVDIALGKIDIRQHNTYALRAALHGHKIPLKVPEIAKPQELGIDDKKAEKVMAQALARKRRGANG